MSSKAGVPPKPLKGILKRKKTDEDLTKTKPAGTVDKKAKKNKRNGDGEGVEESLGDKGAPKNKGKAKETATEGGKRGGGKADVKKGKAAVKDDPSVKSTDAKTEKKSKAKASAVTDAPSSPALLLSEETIKAKATPSKDSAKVKPEKSKKSKVSASPVKVPSPPQTDGEDVEVDEDDEDKENNNINEHAEVAEDSDSSVLLHGFSSESDSSDEEDDEVDGPTLDVDKLPTVAKDDASVKRKLDKAKKKPVCWCFSKHSLMILC